VSCRKGIILAGNQYSKGHDFERESDQLMGVETHKVPVVLDVRSEGSPFSD